MNPLFNLQDQLCYVKCGHCTTILLVSVPRSSLCTVVTVRCGHCTAILSVNMMVRTSLVPFHLLAASLDHHHHQWKQEGEEEEEEEQEGDSNNNPKPWEKNSPFLEEEDNNDDSPVTQTAVTKPPEKRQRAPSAYNCFIKEEIKRLKASNPCMSHKQAFSAASKNWAHLRPSQHHESEGGSYDQEEINVQSMYSGTEQSSKFHIEFKIKIRLNPS
ncbi:PREDICTED: axial regulator YABBY 4 [Ipomoea nil]|uniref:axial regulator YABBY 4 n=1 Tax=Ipomoea nil TaxID=35883 RepID=UPI000900C123|nr:PREDICTED: axial regulator YABBY 4 [Ipomoea nil]